MKKLLSIILAALMVAGSSATALAEETTNQSYKDIYLEFGQQAENVMENYKQRNVSGFIATDFNCDDVPEILAYTESMQYVDDNGDPVYQPSPTQQKELNKITTQFNIVYGLSVENGNLVYQNLDSDTLISTKSIPEKRAHGVVVHAEYKMCGLNNVALLMDVADIYNYESTNKIKVLQYDDGMFKYSVGSIENWDEVYIANARVDRNVEGQEKAYSVTEAIELVLDEYEEVKAKYEDKVSYYKDLYTAYAYDADCIPEHTLNKNIGALIMLDLNLDGCPELMTVELMSDVYDENGNLLIDPETATPEDFYALDVEEYVLRDYISITGGELSVDWSWKLPESSDEYFDLTQLMLLKYLPDEEKPDGCEFVTKFCKIESTDKTYLMTTYAEENTVSMMGYETGIAHRADFSYDELTEYFVSTNVPCASVYLFDKDKKETLSKVDAMKLLLDKYAVAEKEAYKLNDELRISKGEIEVVVNNQAVKFDQKPVIVEGRTLVPLRGVSEALGASVEWKEDTKEIILSRDGDNIVMTVERNTFGKNGSEFNIDVAPQIINSRTLVPVRMIAEAFGCHVEWDETSKKVVIED